MLPRALIIHHDYRRWMELMWYVWKYMAKSANFERMVLAGHAHYHMLLYSSATIVIDEVTMYTESTVNMDWESSVDWDSMPTLID